MSDYLDALIAIAKEREAKAKITVILRKLAERRRAQPPMPEPRYDDIFFEGLEWLGTL